LERREQPFSHPPESNGVSGGGLLARQVQKTWRMGDSAMKTTKAILTAVLLLTSTSAFAGSSLVGVSASVVSSVRLQAAQASMLVGPSSARDGLASDGKYRIMFEEQDRPATDSHYAVVTLLTDERAPSRR
jgi:hypothetical protein